LEIRLHLKVGFFSLRSSIKVGFESDLKVGVELDFKVGFVDLRAELRADLSADSTIEGGSCSAFNPKPEEVNTKNIKVRNCQKS
jgi:hypothetical protein